MKIIPSVPTHALNLCSVAACGAAERIVFDSNRWISRCELTVCYHRWMQWWRNDVGNNLLALQKSYGLGFALIKCHLFWLYCVITGYITGMLLWKCANPTFTHRWSGPIFFLSCSGLYEKWLYCSISGVFWSYWLGNEYSYRHALHLNCFLWKPEPI